MKRRKALKLIAGGVAALAVPSAIGGKVLYGQTKTVGRTILRQYYD